jgi:hypothetical protein
MRQIFIIAASAATFAIIVPSSAQTYLYGAPPGGVGTYSPGPYSNTDDPRWRSNNWRDGAQDDWRDNNWREDRSGWRRDNWRENRADDWRPYSLRDGQAKEKEDTKGTNKENMEENGFNDDGCNMARNRPNNPNAPCRR